MRSQRTREALGTRLARELDERGTRGELYWHTEVDAGRLVYVVSPGKMWTEPKPPTLRMTPGEAAAWLNVPVIEQRISRPLKQWLG